MAEEKKESEETPQQWKPGYREGIKPPEEKPEEVVQHPMGKAFRKGKL